MRFTLATTLAALTYLGVEVQEDDDPESKLDETLADYGLDVAQFLTPETQFSMGYHRGLSGRLTDSNQFPVEGEGADAKPVESLATLVDDGFACGLEARDVPKTPPPSLVFAALQAGEFEFGGLAAWAASLDLTDQVRLATQVEVGSGKTAVVVPAGTPVDLISADVEKDGVPHVIVGYDGLALLVPNADDAPRIVSGDEIVAAPKKRRGGKKGTKAKKPRAERGPSLKDLIIQVAEAKDGGPGPLQTNGQFASRLLALATKAGIRDKASKFMQKADRHVPYYLNIYKPKKDSEVGRMGVEKPFAWVIAAIEARKHYLKAIKGGSSHDEALEQIPEDLRARLEDRETQVETTPAPPKPKKAKQEDGDDS